MMTQDYASILRKSVAKASKASKPSKPSMPSNANPRTDLGKPVADIELGSAVEGNPMIKKKKVKPLV